MNTLLTHSEYNVFKETWKHSTSAFQMLFDLPQASLPRVRTGLHAYVEWLLHETADEEEIDQFGDDYKARDVFCDERIRDGEITQEEAHREVASAIWLDAIKETQFQEHMDALLAVKLREFINIREFISIRDVRVA